MKNNWLSIVIILVLAAGVYFIVDTVRQTAQQAQEALNPIQQANNALQTQVSDLMHPTPTIIPDPVTYINEVRALARLETIQYSVSQVVTAETNQGTFAFAFGNKILVVVHGKVIAGIDMGNMNPEDMSFQNSVLSVKLPPAEVLVTSVDMEKTETYDVQNGIFAEIDPNLVLDALKVGEDKILEVALEDGILEQAQMNAEAYLLKFFAALGYPNTIFVK